MLWTAQFNLGLIYRNGRGVPQHDKTVEPWVRVDSVPALVTLVLLFFNSNGHPRVRECADKKRACKDA